MLLTSTILGYQTTKQLGLEAPTIIGFFTKAFSLPVSDNNGFVKGMREFKQCIEREQIIFNVQVRQGLKRHSRLRFLNALSSCENARDVVVYALDPWA